MKLPQESISREFKVTESLVPVARSDWLMGPDDTQCRGDEKSIPQLWPRQAYALVEQLH